MDWRELAIDKLRNYEASREAIENIPKEIAEIRANMTSIRSAGAMAAPVVSSNGNGREDMYIRSLDRIKELEMYLEMAKHLVGYVDRGLSILNREDRLVLEKLYIHHIKYATEQLCDDLGVMDARTVYKRRDFALRIFTIALYGCVES